MKCLFLYRYSNEYGGIQDLIKRLSNFLKNKGHRVYLLSDHLYYKNHDEMLEEGLEIFYWNKKNILKFLFEKEIDIVCSFEPYKKYIFLTLLFKFLKKNIGTILVFCGSRSENSGRLFRILYTTGIIFKIYDKFIAVSNYAASVAFGGNFMEKIKVIYIPVEIEKYKKTNFARFNLVAIGRICKRKNFEELIEIFGELHKKQKNLSLDIIGGLEKININYFNYLKRLVKEKKLENFINFHINVSESKKLDLLSQSTLYITTSKHEMFGIATVEALASGVPVVAYGNTATKEVCSLSKQILVRDGDRKEMVKKVLDLLKNRKKLREFSTDARKKAEVLFSPKNWVEYEKIFENLTKQKKREKDNFKTLSFEQKVKKYLTAEGGYIWKEFERRKVKRVLDIGCGEGVFLAISPNKIIGIDKNPEMVALCRKRGLQAILLDVEKEKLPFPDNYFDGAVMMRLLEHLCFPKEVFLEINRVLKLNSLFFVIVPTKDHENYWHDYTHVRPYTLKSLKMLAEDTGFEIDEYFYTGNGIPFWGKLGLSKYVNPSKVREKFGIFHTRGNIWAILRKSRNMNKFKINE